MQRQWNDEAANQRNIFSSNFYWPTCATQRKGCHVKNLRIRGPTECFRIYLETRSSYLQPAAYGSLPERAYILCKREEGREKRAVAIAGRLAKWAADSRTIPRFSSASAAILRCSNFYTHRFPRCWRFIGWNDLRYLKTKLYIVIYSENNLKITNFLVSRSTTSDYFSTLEIQGGW